MAGSAHGVSGLYEYHLQYTTPRLLYVAKMPSSVNISAVRALILIYINGMMSFHFSRPFTMT
jgi:hypothetical protein